MNNPTVTICIPTYNNEKTLPECLEYLKKQNYPSDRMDILIIDGGSQDRTLEIANLSGARIISNPFKVEEKGRVIGIRNSSSEFIAMVDADNFLADPDYLIKMLTPMIIHPEICFSEPLRYDSRTHDDLITEYISLTGADDSSAVYLGIYDRMCYFKGKWTESGIIKKAAGWNFTAYALADPLDMPPFGANGTVFRSASLSSIKHDPFLHTDICYRLLSRGFWFAKADTGIIHKQNGSIKTYIQKKIRRLTRNYNEMDREYFFRIRPYRIILLALRCLTVIPLIADALAGFIRKPSHRWVWHPVITELVFFTNVWFSIKKRMGRKK